MRTVALKHKALAVLAALVALSALGGPSTTFAAGTSITPAPSFIALVGGTWSESGATLAQAVQQSTPSPTSILISDQSLLRVGWTVKVDSEYMLIQELTDGGYGSPPPPDTMLVERGMDGSTASYHSNGTLIKARTRVTANIYANGLPSSGWGLGGFSVSITLPPGVEFAKMTTEPAFLASTGRTPWCAGAYNTPGTSNWQITCSTTGNPEDGRYPLGPKGVSGLIATVTLLPLGDPGLYSISLAGSQLVNTAAQVIPATVGNLSIKILECPDADGNGKVDSGDSLQVAKNFGDRGVDSGATLVSLVDTSQTNMDISDQGALVLGDTLGVDLEQMTVAALQEGEPDTMTVARAVNNTKTQAHSAGTHIFIATYDGNRDGKKGYTKPRDVTHEGVLDSGDSLLIAQAFGTRCPAP